MHSTASDLTFKYYPKFRIHPLDFQEVYYFTLNFVIIP